MSGSPRERRSRPAGNGPATVEITTTTDRPTVPHPAAVALLLDRADDTARQLEREARAFRDGAEWGHSIGFEAGWSAAEDSWDSAWAREAAKVRGLAERDDPDRRVAAAEQYARALAIRQYDSVRAWRSAADAGRVPLRALTRRWEAAAS